MVKLSGIRKWLFGYWWTLNGAEVLLVIGGHCGKLKC
jgi:hypothetical protein